MVRTDLYHHGRSFAQAFRSRRRSRRVPPPSAIVISAQRFGASTFRSTIAYSVRTFDWKQAPLFAPRAFQYMILSSFELLFGPLGRWLAFSEQSVRSTDS